MPFSFAVVQPNDIDDPGGALVTNPGGESNNGSAGIGSSVTFGATGGSLAQIPITIDENVFTDDPAGSLSDPVTIGGTTFSAGANIETDYSFVAQDPVSGIYYRISHVTINNQYVGAVVSRGFDATLTNPGDPDSVVGLVGKYPSGTELEIVNPDPVSDAPAWEDFVVENNYNLGPGQAYDNDVDLSPDGSVVICFGRGTNIRLADGRTRAVEDLEVGTAVMTDNGAFRDVIWIGQRMISVDELRRWPALHPIRFAAGSLGANIPAGDLIVSPQHRMLVASPIVGRMFGMDRCLVPAKHLLGLPGVTTVPAESEVTYFHILLEDHQVIFANDAPAESLLPGAWALKSLSDAARAEIAALFPETLAPDWAPEPAYQTVGRARTARLIARHLKNNKPLVAKTKRAA
ncbi:MAG: Hint domain-containing protein [Pseudomonadota bacterium]